MPVRVRGPSRLRRTVPAPFCEEEKQGQTCARVGAISDTELCVLQKERWISLPRGGAPVGNGPFVPCKPPLRSAASEGLDEGDRYSSHASVCCPLPPPACIGPILRGAACTDTRGRRFDANMFMDKQVNARRNVGLVVSLMDPKKRIPAPTEQEWDDWDAEYKAIVPKSAEQVAQDFQKIVRAFCSNKANANRMVAVFCEDGTNLSGYAIVSYMHQVLGMSLSSALTAFANLRSRSPN